jgi:hypothetical protein
VLCVQVLTNNSGNIHEYCGDILIVKLDSVLKGALVDIIPVLIMKNIIDTSSLWRISVYMYICTLYCIIKK